MGVSTVSMRSMLAPSGKPDGGSGVRAPRTPALRALAQRPRLQAEGVAEAQVAGREGIGLAQPAQGDELRGPIADAGQSTERADRGLQILRSVEPDAALHH